MLLLVVFFVNGHSMTQCSLQPSEAAWITNKSCPWPISHQLIVVKLQMGFGCCLINRSFGGWDRVAGSQLTAFPP